MSKRRGRRKATSDRPLSAGGHVEVETWDGTDWQVRRVSGSAATKPYRCPGCDHVIPMATPHVVVWPSEPSLFAGSGLEERRHWHSGCWRARGRRPGR